MEWARIFESDLEGLMRMRGGSFTSLEAELYHTILMAYFAGDPERLLQATRQAELGLRTRPELEVVALLGRIRYQLRTQGLRSEDLDRARELAMPDSPWKGEILFVLSHAAAAQEHHADSRDYSLQAARALKAIGARKKAVRALMNAISSESCIRTDKHYLADLHFVYREAKAAGDVISIGTTLLNLSREYQKLGLYSAALKFAHRSVAVYSRNAGSLDYHLSLAHRAHLFCQLGSFREARADAELALSGSFPEVGSAIRILSESFPDLFLESVTTLASDISATPTWKERRQEKPARRQAGLEGRLVELLTRRPHGRQELCRILYGELLSPEVTQNRLNNLLNRIRKQHPALIVFSEGKYHLAEVPVYPEFVGKLQEAQ